MKDGMLPGQGKSRYPGRTVAGVFAHPDDEAFLAGAGLLEAARRGWRTVCLVATQGEAGQSALSGELPPEALAVVRRAELRQAADALGVASLRQCSFGDGELLRLDRIRWSEAVETIVHFLQEERAEVVVTFPWYGYNAHPDHIAVHRMVMEAVSGGGCPKVERVFALAHPSFPGPRHYGRLRVNAAAHWPRKREAMLAHRTQSMTMQRMAGHAENEQAPPPRLRWECYEWIWRSAKQADDGTYDFWTDGLD